MSPARKRADVLLVERGLFESRARARAAIEAGLVTADDKQVAKPSETIAEDAVIQAEGYKTATVTVSHKTSNGGAAGVAGNVLLGGVIGLGVDLATGASQDLTPNPVTLKLEPVVKAAEAPKSDQPKPAAD